MFRRLLAALLCAVLFLLSPGLEPYRLCAAGAPGASSGKSGKAGGAWSGYLASFPAGHPFASALGDALKLDLGAIPVVNAFENVLSKSGLAPADLAGLAPKAAAAAVKAALRGAVEKGIAEAEGIPAQADEKAAPGPTSPQEEGLLGVEAFLAAALVLAGALPEETVQKAEKERVRLEPAADKIKAKQIKLLAGKILQGMDNPQAQAQPGAPGLAPPQIGEGFLGKGPIQHLKQAILGGHSLIIDEVDEGLPFGQLPRSPRSMGLKSAPAGKVEEPKSISSVGRLPGPIWSGAAHASRKSRLGGALNRVAEPLFGAAATYAGGMLGGIFFRGPLPDVVGGFIAALGLAVFAFPVSTHRGLRAFFLDAEDVSVVLARFLPNLLLLPVLVLAGLGVLAPPLAAAAAIGAYALGSAARRALVPERLLSRGAAGPRSFIARHPFLSVLAWLFRTGLYGWGLAGLLARAGEKFEREEQEQLLCRLFPEATRVRSLLSAAESPYRTLSLMALRLLEFEMSELGDPSGDRRQGLERIFRSHPDAEVRAEAMGLLVRYGEQGKPLEEDMLLEALRSREGPIRRRAAAEALLRETWGSAKAGAIEALRALLQDEDPQTRRDAAWAYYGLSGEVPPKDILSSVDWQTWTVMERRVRDRFLDLALAFLERESNLSGQEAFVSAVLGSALPWSTRLTAFINGRGMGTGALRTALIAAAERKAYIVGNEALQGAALAALESEDQELSALAARALGRARLEPDRLFESLRSPFVHVRANAARLLKGSLAEVNARNRELVRIVLMDPDVSVRRALAEGEDRIVEIPAALLFEALARESDAGVRSWLLSQFDLASYVGLFPAAPASLPAETRAFLRTCLEAPEQGVRAYAAAILQANGESGLPEAWPSWALAEMGKGQMKFLLSAFPVLPEPLLKAAEEALSAPETDESGQTRLLEMLRHLNGHPRHMEMLARLVGSVGAGLRGKVWGCLLEQAYRLKRFPPGALLELFRSWSRELEFKGYKVRVRLEEVPPELYAGILAALKKGGAEAGRAVAFCRNVLSNPETVPEPPRDFLAEVLALLPAMEDGARLEIVKYLSRWKDVGAKELLESLYPGRIGDLLEFMPQLGHIPAQGLTVSALGSEAGMERFLAYLREVREELGPERYAVFAAGFPDLVSMRPRVIVRYARGGRHAAGTYRLPYAVAGSDAVPSPDEHVGATLSEGPPAREDLRAAAGAFNALIEANFEALDLLARNAGSLSKKTARAALGIAARMVESYRLLDPEDAKRAQERLDALHSELERLWAGVPEGAPLPRPIAALVSELAVDAETLNEFLQSGVSGETPPPKFMDVRNAKSAEGVETLNGLVLYLHGKADEAMAGFFNRQAKEESESGLLTLAGSRVTLLNVGEGGLSRGRRILNPALALLAREGLPSEGTALLDGNDVRYHAKLGQHRVELHYVLAEPDEGGLLRVRYSEGGADEGNQLRLAYLAAILRRLGIPCRVKGNRYLDAALGKDHGLLGRSQLERAVPVLLRALGRTGNLDWALQGVQKAHSMERALELADSLAGVHLAEERVPFELSGRKENDRLLGRYEAYRREDGARAALRAGLNRELVRLGLSPIPEGPFGQAVIDEHFTRPIDLALARGELSLDGSGRPLQNLDYRPVEDLAAHAVQNEEEAFAAAAVLSAAELGDAAFEPIGAVGRLRAERAQWLWDDGEALTVYVLRDPESGAVLYARALRAGGSAPKALPAGELEGLLESRGLAVTPYFMPGAPLRAFARRLLRLGPLPAPRWPEIAGLAASAGKGGFVTGRAAFRGGRGVRPGDIFVVPYTTPDDIRDLENAAGVVPTGGGLLSHAGIITRELGKAAVILSGARWDASSGRPVLRLRLLEPAAAERNGDGLWIASGVRVRNLSVREGDLLRVDGGRGTLTLLRRPGAGSDALGEAHDLLEAVRAGSANEDALAAWLAAQKPEARAELGVFILEEALWRKDLEAKRARILDSLMGLDPRLRGRFQEHGRRLLAEGARRLEEEGGEGVEASEAAVKRLEAGISEFEIVARALDLGEDALAPLRGRLARLREGWESVKRRLREGLRERALAFIREVDRLGEEALPVLRRLLRALRLHLPGFDTGVLAARAAALAAAKRARLLVGGRVVLGLEEVDDDLRDLVGGKSAKLGEVARVVEEAGGYVPPGVAQLTGAYRRFLEETGIGEEVGRLARELDDFLEGADPKDPETWKGVDARSERLQALIRSKTLDPERGVGREILEALRSRGLGEAMTAVRSSARQEDQEGAAFAGAAETALYVAPEEVLEKAVSTWASFWLPRGIEYRWRQGIRSVELEPASAAQLMVDAESAGIAFSEDPVTSEPHFVINATWGQGEGAVSGIAEVDQYVINEDGEEIRPARVAHKRVQVRRRADGRGAEIAPVPPALRKRRVLGPEQLRRLARVLRGLRDHFGYGLDTEYAFAAGDERVALLQARPITTAAKAFPLPGRPDFSALMGFHLVQVLRARGVPVPGAAQAAWEDAARRYMLEQALAASIKRVHRIADRIANLNPDPKVRGGEREWVRDPKDGSRVKLIDSSVLAARPWLREALLRASRSEAEAREAIPDAASLLRFYEELAAPEISAIYPRGRSNNEPWLEIARAVRRLESAGEGAALRLAIDELKNRVHNTGAGFLEHAPDGRRLLEFADLTRAGPAGTDIAYAMRFADPGLAARARDLRASGR